MILHHKNYRFSPEKCFSSAHADTIFLVINGVKTDVTIDKLFHKINGINNEVISGYSVLEHLKQNEDGMPTFNEGKAKISFYYEPTPLYEEDNTIKINLFIKKISTPLFQWNDKESDVEPVLIILEDEYKKVTDFIIGENDASTSSTTDAEKEEIQSVEKQEELDLKIHDEATTSIEEESKHVVEENEPLINKEPVVSVDEPTDEELAEELENEKIEESDANVSTSSTANKAYVENELWEVEPKQEVVSDATQSESTVSEFIVSTDELTSSATKKPLSRKEMIKNYINKKRQV